MSLVYYFFGTVYLAAMLMVCDDLLCLHIMEMVFFILLCVR